nr:hypothetical protein [Tanacetum cinerariifolium]
MVAILENGEFNTDFHPMVDFIAASPLSFGPLQGLKQWTVGNKMHKAFPLPEESSHWQYKFLLPVKVFPADNIAIGTVDHSLLSYFHITVTGEGSGTPTEPHHTPFPEVESSHPTTSSIPLPSIPTAPIPTVTHTDTTPIIQYSRSARIAQSSALPIVADEPASLVRDDSQGKACPNDSGFIADQDRATIAKSSTFPHDSALRVTSPADNKGSMQ